jgi:polyisoprenyl-teichoic acid--peptidoglycan teichoic acid transferase
MISIPRDIYMQIPGTQVRSRINAAYDIGAQIDYPGGPAMLTVKTVQNILGIRIHHHVVVNFEVFNAAIDALGTIQVCPKAAIHDEKYPDNNYGYMTVDFQPGCQELDSTRLLQYARVRHNAGDDFGRSERQQEVIKAVRDKILSLGGVGSLVTKAGNLWGTVKTYVQTDMTFEQMVQLAQIAQSIPRENIKSAVLTDRDSYVLPATTPQNEQVFTPNYEKIHALIEELFGAAK